jgi:NTE family protein
MKFKPIYLLCIVSCFITDISLAQRAVVNGDASQPRIALVLSGGGARGAAHIGVLKVLEQMRIPIDLIVGTSMGSLVGGLYASGMSAEQIEQRFQDTDWNHVFSGRPPRENLSFRQKQDDDEALFQFEIGVDTDGLTLPSELVAGQKLSFLLRTLFNRTLGVDSFDALPTPFRAVAADISSDEMVVLGNDDLASAVRASMAVPGVLPAVEINGRELVDGGVVRNLPVDVALATGAEYIIAVDVSSPLQPLRGESVIGVAAQTFRLLTVRNVAEQLKTLREGDTLITPELSAVGFADFSKLDEAIAQGEAAMRRAASGLQGLVVSRRDYQVYLKKRRDRLNSLPSWIRIDSLEVVGLTRVDPRQIIQRISTRAGQGVELQRLEEDIKRIYEIGEFQIVRFRLIRKQGENHLLIEAREKPWGPNYLRFGLRLDSNFKQRNDFTLLSNFRRTQINRLGAEWKTIVKLGDETAVSTDFFQPLSYSGRWFIAPQFFFERDESQGPFSEDKGEIFLGRLDLGLQQRNVAQFSLGVERGKIDFKRSSIFGDEEIGIDWGGARARLLFDQLDNNNFPRFGTFAGLDVFASRSGLGADFEYDRLQANLTHSHSLGPHTMLVLMEFGTGLGSDIQPFDEFHLGGFLRLSGLEREALSGDAIALFQLVYFQRVGRLPGPIGDGIYLGGALETGNVWEDNSKVDLGDLRRAGLLLAGLDTVLGPIYLGYGRADRGKDSFYLILGRPF